MEERFLDVTDLAAVRARGLQAVPASAAWDRPSDPEPLRHRIHGYPAKFPAFLTSNALAYARREGLEVQRLGDIFCGCGTVAFEARREGLSFWGCDINPVATLIARTKSARVDPVAFAPLARQCVSRARRYTYGVQLSATASARLAKWFTPNTYVDLARLLRAIDALTADDTWRNDALRCAFSAILKSCSRWKVRAIKPTLDPSKPERDVFATFLEQCDLMARAFAQSSDLPGDAPAIHRADVLSIDAPAVPLDLIVTSPPYVTSYEYADLHQLSALWLGYADDHRTLRARSIGSAQHDLDFRRTYRELNEVGVRTVFALFNEDRVAARAVAQFFLDMQKVAERCREFLRPGGAAVFVIGNTRYGNVGIDNASHLTEALLSAGFSRVRATRRRISNKAATPYRDPGGRFTRTRTSRPVYAEEYVLIAHA